MPDRAASPGSLPNPEWVAFDIGVKPGLRLTISSEDAVREIQSLTARGLSALPAERPISRPGRPDETILYVARAPDAARALRDAEAPVLPGKDSRLSVADIAESHERVGALLGFPSCCTAAFVERVTRGVTTRAGGGSAHEDYVAAEDAIRRSRAFHGRLNDMLRRERLWIIPFYPCKYDCETALLYADAVWDALVSAAPAAARSLRESLSAPVRLLPDGTRVQQDGRSRDALLVAFDRF
jgi:hypothetical protein